MKNQRQQLLKADGTGVNFNDLISLRPGHKEPVLAAWASANERQVATVGSAYRYDVAPPFVVTHIGLT
jgi:hypothetical protein